jgi:hypothetical protein
MWLQQSTLINTIKQWEQCTSGHIYWHLKPVVCLQERNVAMELDLARAAMETVVRQLAAVSKTNQVGTNYVTHESAILSDTSQAVSLGVILSGWTSPTACSN